jgi:hypothetical protein
MFYFLAVAAAGVMGCPAEEAHYVLRHSPDVSADFRRVESGPDWPSNLAMAVRFSRSGRTSWWLPWNGGTDGLQNIASTTDVGASGWRPPDPDDGPRPYGNREFLSTDADYNVIDHVPRAGEPAPAHILIPNGGGAGDTIFQTKQFFDLAGCSASVP